MHVCIYIHVLHISIFVSRMQELMQVVTTLIILISMCTLFDMILLLVLIPQVLFDILYRTNSVKQFKCPLQEEDVLKKFI